MPGADAHQRRRVAWRLGGRDLGVTRSCLRRRESLADRREGVQQAETACAVRCGVLSPGPGWRWAIRGEEVVDGRAWLPAAFTSLKPRRR